MKKAPPSELNNSELPKKFWKIRDAAVDHALTNSPLPADLKHLQAWLETDGWDNLLEAWINEDIAVNLNDLASHRFSDTELRDYGGVEDSEVITNDIRIKFARSIINGAIAECDGSSIHSYLLQQNDGPSAILGCTAEIHGQAGPSCVWHGVFVDKETFYNHLRASGFLLPDEADTLADDKILALWQIK